LTIFRIFTLASSSFSLQLVRFNYFVCDILGLYAMMDLGHSFERLGDRSTATKRVAFLRRVS